MNVWNIVLLIMTYKEFSVYKKSNYNKKSLKGYKIRFWEIICITFKNNNLLIFEKAAESEKSENNKVRKIINFYPSRQDAQYHMVQHSTNHMPELALRDLTSYSMNSGERSGCTRATSINRTQKWDNTENYSPQRNCKFYDCFPLLTQSTTPRQDRWSLCVYYR